MLVKQTLSSILSVLLLTLTSTVLAETLPDIAEREYQTEDCYVIHYNAIKNDFLSRVTAQTYGITRSKKRAMLTVSIRQPLVTSEEGCPEKSISQTQAVTAKVEAQIVNLEGQLKVLDMRQIEEGSANNSKAIYYIDDFRITNKETWNFTITVVIDGQEKKHEIKFSQQFFVE